MTLTLGAVVRGRTSLGYRTGGWRDRRPILHEDLCKSCGQCEMVCPDNAVYLVGKKYLIDYDYCKGCGLCAYECPTDAIEMVLEEK